MKRIAALSAAIVAASASGVAVLVGLAGPAAASSCTSVNTSKGTLTAVSVNPSSVTSPVDAIGCDIGVYYDGSGSGSFTLSDVTIENATQYGVFVDGGHGSVNVDITGSTITNIGDNATRGSFTGGQHGVAIYYYGFNASSTVTGTVDGNTVSQYQKGGIVVNGAQSSVAVTDNTVTGLGPVPFIAQNGIQFGYGATPTALTGNTVTGNVYTQGASVGYVSAGVLLYQANVTGRDVGMIAATNHIFANQANVLYIKA